MRVLPRGQPQLGARRDGSPRAAPRAAGGTTAGRTAASRRWSGHPIRGPARAARSRPGRRGCAPAAPAHRHGRRRAHGSGRRGRRPRGRPPCPPRRKEPGRQHIPGPVPARARSRRPSAESGCRPWSTISAVVGITVAAAAVSASESGPPDSATHHRSSPAAWSRGETRDRGAQRGYSTLSIHRCGSSISVGSGRFRRPVQMALKRCHPDPGHHVVDERLAPGVLAQLGVDARAARASVAAAAAACAAGVRRTGGGSSPQTAPRRARRHPSRGRRGPPAACRAPAADRAPRAAARTARPASDRGPQPNSVPAPAPITTLRRSRRYSASLPTTWVTSSPASSVSTASALRHVVGQPRVGPELHPVGDLVQAHPQPEVRGDHPQLALDGDHVRVHQQQLAAAGGPNGSYCPRMPDDTNASTAPVCDAGDPPADRARLGVTGVPAAGHHPHRLRRRHGSTGAGRRCAPPGSRRPRSGRSPRAPAVRRARADSASCSIA